MQPIDKNRSATLRKPDAGKPSLKAAPFAEENMEGSWFKRAVAAGLRYTKQKNDGSETRVIPEFDLGDAGTPASAEKTTNSAKSEERGQFGPPEKTLFKTAINQFLVMAEQSHIARQKQAKFHHDAMIENTTSQPLVKGLKVAAVIGMLLAVALIAQRFHALKAQQAAKRSHVPEVEQLSFDDVETTAPTKTARNIKIVPSKPNKP